MIDIENFALLLEHVELAQFCAAIESTFNLILRPSEPCTTRHEFQQNVITQLSQLPAPRRLELEQWAERVVLLTDTPGQLAIDSIRSLLSPSQQQQFACLPNQFDRSLWLFAHAPALFQEALAARYADESRHTTACYSGFVCPAGLTLHLDEASLAAFRPAISDLLHCPVTSVAVNVYTRRKTCSAHFIQFALHHICVHYNVPSEAVLRVQEGHRDSINITRANTVHVTYEPASGYVEVLSKLKTGREKMARLVAHILLQAPVRDGRLPLKTYHYQFLARPVTLDISGEPVTAAVVTKLGFTAANGRSLKVKIGSKDVESIYSAKRELAGQPFNASRHPLTSAHITVKLLPQHGERGRSVTIILRGENGCNVNSKRERDRQLCDRLLRKWNIVRAIGESNAVAE